MNESKSTSNKTSDDIDLVILAERTVLYFRKYRAHYLVATLVGILLGTLVFFIFPKLYKSRLILHSTYLTNAEQIQIVDSWDELLKRNEYGVLSTTFNCSPGILHKLSDLEAKEIQKVFTPNNPNGFLIDARVTDLSILDDLQKGIVYGLENTEYMSQRVTSRKDNLKELIEKVKLEISKLDTTKAMVQKIISSNSPHTSSLMLDISGINSQMLGMNEKLLSYQEELKFSNGIQVLQGFIKLTTPVSLSLKVLIILGLILSFSVTYFYTLYRQVKDRLKKRVIQHA